MDEFVNILGIGSATTRYDVVSRKKKNPIGFSNLETRKTARQRKK